MVNQILEKIKDTVARLDNLEESDELARKILEKDLEDLLNQFKMVYGFGVEDLKKYLKI